ncbi:uncharacterized protein J4E88_003407 [Alternaria novae-zelandiae]|uniref:uncharacterized protein n=1 Tax=Alternaria ethzedia TaxID=181014 RepID=UPI0020C4C23A|nr:uncharacterized protein J4E87_004930 [Alternaria ethzedia]XP_049257402.1 uncharacterized protein J4E88_003407 [Alternaria novae-zelandiae]KAI4625084.1 hypothetical protein J4E87_004930 [Alternaria ethzedia]KAI4687816.1 hypothetical protein J4E88_003407 [Alternaria novae-zelandiae]
MVQYRDALKVFAVPERVIQFRVIWEDDRNCVQVNRGYRVQFNSALGPYKGGLRFHPSVNLSVLKFLSLEQTLKNALTGLNLGGAKGGSDFDPKGKSDHEIRRFCVSFMRELSKYIGADTDVPAGDVGCTRREVGWMFGAFKAATTRWEGCITNKGDAFGGSLMKLEATGFGLVHYVSLMIEYASDGAESTRGKKVAISGSGNVAQYAAIKAIDAGAVVLTLSDSKGTLKAISVEGFTKDDIALIASIKKKRLPLSDIMAMEQGQRFEHLEGERPWKHVKEVDIALPSATQNEMSKDEAEALISAGCRFIAEGSNMGCAQDAIQLFESRRADNPNGRKGANIGGSAVSGLEMVQNSQRIAWPAAQVEAELYRIVESCFHSGIEAAKNYTDMRAEDLPSLFVGSNIAGFVKLADAMHAQGDWW